MSGRHRVVGETRNFRGGCLREDTVRPPRRSCSGQVVCCTGRCNLLPSFPPPALRLHGHHWGVDTFSIRRAENRFQLSKKRVCLYCNINTQFYCEWCSCQVEMLRTGKIKRANGETALFLPHPQKMKGERKPARVHLDNLRRCIQMSIIRTLDTF